MRRCPAGLYSSLRHFVMIIRHAAVWINSAIVQWRVQTIAPVNPSVLKITSQLEMGELPPSPQDLRRIKRWSSAWKLCFNQFLNCRSVVNYWQSIKWNKLREWPSFPFNSHSSLQVSVDFQLKFYSGSLITCHRLALHKHTSPLN